MQIRRRETSRYLANCLREREKLEKVRRAAEDAN